MQKGPARDEHVDDGVSEVMMTTMETCAKRCTCTPAARRRRRMATCTAVGTQEAIVAGTAAVALLAAVAVGTKREARACASCGGYGGVRCVVCDGTGVEAARQAKAKDEKKPKADFFGVQPAPAGRCRACGGVGIVRCKTCGGAGYDRKL